MTDLPEISETERRYMALHFRERSAGKNSQFERWADMLYPQPQTLLERALRAAADVAGIDVDSLSQDERDVVRAVLRTTKAVLDALDGAPGDWQAVLRSDIDNVFRGGEIDA